MISRTFTWDIRRHAASALVLASFLAFNTATSKSGSSGSSTSSSTVGPVGTPSSTPDLNISSVQSALGCAAKPSSQGCRILNEFDGADPLTALPSSGRDVWYGESYGVGGSADDKRELFFLQLEKTPSGERLGSARSLIPENAGEVTDANAVLSAARRGASSPKGSRAADFMRTAVPPKGAQALVATTGKS